MVQIPHPSAVLQHHYYYCAWARRSDACTLQVNKECHWQPGGKKGGGQWKQREVRRKDGGGRKPKMGMRGGKLKQLQRDRRWHWQTKRYHPPAPGLPPKGSEGWHRSRRGYFSPVSKTREWKRASRTSVRICMNHMN